MSVPNLNTEQLAALFAQVPSRPVSSFTPAELELADAILSRAGRPGVYDQQASLRIIQAAVDELNERKIIALSPAFMAGAVETVDVGHLLEVARCTKMAAALLAAHHAELRSIDDQYFAR